MSDIIQLLPDSVANQIAAGEVIQRPASVVKELVENALDAGAHEVHVIVVDAGRTLIQVVDDGCGMSPTDARLSFERHATSKIRQAADLFDLHTMGFRGEALASIAAVAQVSLTTRKHDEEVGTQISIHGSRFMSQEPVACPPGSQFKVENLFFNVPARRKFLKSPSTELNNILTAYERIVLVNPQVAFSLHSNGTEISNLPVAGLRQRIVDVFGKRLNQDLLPVTVDTTICHVKGFVGKPESAKRKGAHQFFFANGRYMKHNYFAKAVMAPFERLVPQGEQVPFFLYIDVNPADIDVNIHPTKTEIKFENEQAIWQILSAAVKEAVGKFNDVPSIDFDTEGRPDFPPMGQQGQFSPPTSGANVRYNPFKETPARGTDRSRKVDHWEVLYGNEPTQGQQIPGLFDEPQVEESAADIIAEKSPSHYQYKGRFIMTAVKSGLMIIDQHRAHQRVLYEEYLDKMAHRKWATQSVLFPDIVRLPPTEAAVMQQILSQLEAIGFSISDLGGGSFSVNGVPAGIDGVEPRRLLEDMVAAAKERLGPRGDIDGMIAWSLAKSAAIPYGQLLSNEEMENLINRLFACGNVNMTPDGKSIICILEQGEIERLLG